MVVHTPPPLAALCLQLGTVAFLLLSTVALSQYLNISFKKLPCSMLHIASLPVPPAPLNLRHYGTLQMFYYCCCRYFIQQAYL